MAFAPQSSRARPMSARSATRGNFVPDNLDVMPTAHLLELKRSVDVKLAARERGETIPLVDDARRSQGATSCSSLRGSHTIAITACCASSGSTQCKTAAEFVGTVVRWMRRRCVVLASGWPVCYYAQDLSTLLQRE